MKSEAQRKAKQKYRKKIKTISIEIYPAEADIKERLETNDEPNATYIKRLIREDIERTQKGG